MSTTSQYNKLYKDKRYNPKEPFKIQIVQDWVDENDFKFVLDVGCGRGHYMKALKGVKLLGLEPSDIANRLEGVLKTDILGIEVRQPVWDGLYCMDVLEHIPKYKIDANLERLASFAPKAILGIANHSDHQNGVELHLIQEDANWWLPLLRKYWKNVRLTYEPLRYMVFECSQ